MSSPPEQKRRCGRPRVEIDHHKELIFELRRANKSWVEIEQILLDDHNCVAPARTIFRRCKEWDAPGPRYVRTDRSNEDLKARILTLWADRDARPRNDTALAAVLVADGFAATPSGIAHLRKEMQLFRRWDEKLGRTRPANDPRRPKRGKKKKKQRPGFTGAQLAPPPGEGDGGGEVEEPGNGGEVDEPEDEGDSVSAEPHSFWDQPDDTPSRDQWYPPPQVQPAPQQRALRGWKPSVAGQTAEESAPRTRRDQASPMATGDTDKDV